MSPRHFPPPRPIATVAARLRPMIPTPVASLVDPTPARVWLHRLTEPDQNRETRRARHRQALAELRPLFAQVWDAIRASARQTAADRVPDAVKAQISNLAAEAAASGDPQRLAALLIDLSQVARRYLG